MALLPPTSIEVLGQPVTITALPAADIPDAYGLWYELARAIEIRDDLSPLDTRDTVLHETFHAIRAHQGRAYGGEVEEDYVRSLASGLALVLRDNPKFAKWLTNFPKA